MLTTVQRAENYRKQTGRADLTPRQIRRLVKKLGRPVDRLTVKAVTGPVADVAVNIAADTSGYRDGLKAAAVCKCGAFPGQKCVTASGNVARKNHSYRTAA